MSTDTAPARIKWPDQSVFREGVPYRLTESCAFFATQRACQHLRGEGLGETEYQRFFSAKQTLNALLQESQDRGQLTTPMSLALSLNFIVPYLREKFIDVTHIFMRAEEIQRVVDTYPDPLTEYPFIPSEGQQFPTPFMACVGYPDGQLHMFYVQDPDDFEVQKQQHILPGGKLVAMICVQAAKEP